MTSDDWQPKSRTVFSDDEIIQALRSTPAGQRRGGNLWSFFQALPRPERDRLLRDAGVASDDEHVS